MKKFMKSLFFLFALCNTGIMHGMRQEPSSRLVQSFTLDAQFGQIDGVKKYIEAGFDINAQDSTKWTALMAAASRGRTDIVEFLIANHAAPDLQDGNGHTALMLAAMYKFPVVVNILITKAHANPNIISSDGRTALSFAAEWADVEIAQPILAVMNPNLIDAVDVRGFNALMHAIFSNKVPLVKLLIAAHAKINASNNSSNALICAAKHARAWQHEIIDLLCFAIEAERASQIQTLHAAWEKAPFDLCVLTEKYINPFDTQDRRGNTALMCAAPKRGSLANVQRLLAAGATVDIKNADGHDVNYLVKQSEEEPNPISKLTVLVTLDPEKNECPICYQKGGDFTVIRPCEHYFHTGCLNAWLANHNTCPMCRQIITRHDENIRLLAPQAVEANKDEDMKEAK